MAFFRCQFPVLCGHLVTKVSGEIIWAKLHERILWTSSAFYYTSGALQITSLYWIRLCIIDMFRGSFFVSNHQFLLKATLKSDVET